MKAFLFVSLLLLILVCSRCSVLNKCDCSSQFVLTGFPEQINNQLPENILPHLKIPEEFITLTTRIDTIQKKHIYTKLQAPKVIVFDVDKKEYDQYVAIEREKDWVLIDWAIFKLKSPAVSSFKWIKFKNEKTPFLLATSDGQNDQKTMFYDSDIKDTYLLGCENLSRAKNYCLIDPLKLELLLDNVIVGYDYSYEERYHFKEPIPNDTTNYYNGHKNSTKCMRSLWYDLEFRLDKGEIAIKKTFSEDKIVTNESIKYDSEEQDKIKGIKQPDKITICKQIECYPILKEGIYKFKNNSFIMD